jgi:hypothetical protein
MTETSNDAGLPDDYAADELDAQQRQALDAEEQRVCDEPVEDDPGEDHDAPAPPPGDDEQDAHDTLP